MHATTLPRRVTVTVPPRSTLARRAARPCWSSLTDAVFMYYILYYKAPYVKAGAVDVLWGLLRQSPPRRLHRLIDILLGVRQGDECGFELRGRPVYPAR